MAWAEFGEAIAPEPVCILGLKLKPLSIGHYILLSRIGSPWITGTIRQATAADLLKAALICAQTFEESLKTLSDSRGLAAKAWRRKVYWRLWLFWPRKIDWPQAAALFGAYLEKGWRQPKIWTDKEDGFAKVGAPWEMRLLSRGISVGLSLQECLNLHIPLLWYIVLTAVEREKGEKLFYDERDKQIDAALKQLGKNKNARLRHTRRPKRNRL